MFPDSQTCKNRFCTMSAADFVSSLLTEIQQDLMAEYDDKLTAETKRDLSFQCI